MSGNGFYDDPSFNSGASLYPPSSRPGSLSGPSGDARSGTLGRNTSTSTVGSFLPVSEQVSPQPQWAQIPSSSNSPNHLLHQNFAYDQVQSPETDTFSPHPPQQQSSNQHQQYYPEARGPPENAMEEKARMRLELQGRYQNPEDDDFFDDGSEEGDEEANILRFFTPALLSNVAVQLRDKVVRGDHIKGSIPFPNSFTGKDIVVGPSFVDASRFLLTLF